MVNEILEQRPCIQMEPKIEREVSLVLMVPSFLRALTKEIGKIKGEKSVLWFGSNLIFDQGLMGLRKEVIGKVLAWRVSLCV